MRSVVPWERWGASRRSRPAGVAGGCDCRGGPVLGGLGYGSLLSEGELALADHQPPAQIRRVGLLNLDELLQASIFEGRSLPAELGGVEVRLVPIGGANPERPTTSGLVWWFTLVELNLDLVGSARRATCIRFRKVRRVTRLSPTSRRPSVPVEALENGGLTRSVRAGDHNETRRWRKALDLNIGKSLEIGEPGRADVLRSRWYVAGVTVMMGGSAVGPGCDSGCGGLGALFVICRLGVRLLARTGRSGGRDLIGALETTVAVLVGVPAGGAELATGNKGRVRHG